MTGHGRGVAEVSGRRTTVEIRAVNHRYFEVKLRTTQEAALEDRVAQAVRRRAERGSFTVALRDEWLGAQTGARADVGLARAVAKALEEVRSAVGLSEPVTLALVVAQPGVVQVGDPIYDRESTFVALEKALDELVAMRRREGEALAVDLKSRLDRLDAIAAEVERLGAAAPEAWQRRLKERIQRLLKSASAEAMRIDEQRLTQEVAILADRTDVTEEIVRLRSHLEQARGLLDLEKPVGRRLDFLVQELGREVNTIGAKSQSAEIARLVVEAKAEVEKIREQVQNVE